MLGWRRFLIVLFGLAIVLTSRAASASLATEAKTRVWDSSLRAPTLLRASVDASPGKHRAIEALPCDFASGRRFRWKGRWFENVAGGIYDVRARWWSPQLGAFLSVDEFAYHDRNSTLWGWPGQNPVRLRDPSGHFDPGSFGAWLAAQGANGGLGGAGGAGAGLGAGFAALAVADVAILGALAYEVNGLINDLNTPTVYGGGAQAQGGVCSASGGGGMGGGGAPPVISGGGGGEDDAGRNPLSFNSQQLGHKFGEHMGDLPGYQTPQQYQDLANSIYNNPNAGVSTASNGDTLYQLGNNILRVGPNGSFVSLYPSF